jgi:hypothetical protein
MSSSSSINYCIVQEAATEQQQILGLLLSIELYHKQTKCIVSCSESVKSYIECFPKMLDLNLDFRLIDKEEKFNCLTYIKNIFKTLQYGIETYGECLLVSKELIMTNSIQIPDMVKEQGIGFIKKTCQVAEAAYEFQRYSISLLYVNKMDYINQFIKHYETELKCESLFETSFADYTLEQLKEQNEECIRIYAHLAWHFLQECGLEHFLNDYSYVGTEDFFAYEDSVKMTDITKTLMIRDKSISFCNIRTATADKRIQQLNNYFLNILVNKHIVYMSLLNLKMSNKKLQIIVPKRPGIGIWDRTNDIGGLYELIDYLTESATDYLTQVESDIDFFSFGNCILTDKPSHIWLHSGIKKYTHIFLCNYDKSLTDALPSLPLSSKFLFYYAHHPKVLEEFLIKQVVDAVEIKRSIEFMQVKCKTITKSVTKTELDASGNEVIVPVSIRELRFTLTYNGLCEEVDYQTLLEKLLHVKYGYVEIMDVNLIATYLALGVVPVILFTDSVIYELVEKEHYLTTDSACILSDEEYKRIQQNGLAYYNGYIKPAACLNKLFNHIFVRDL